MKAILLAGGKGTRLRPLTIHTPKPIVPIFNRPFLHYQLDLLKQVPEIDEVILSLNYQPRRIEEIFGDGSDVGIKVRYVVEPAPLGTAGAIKYAGDKLTESVVVFNGDVLTELDLGAVIRLHRERQARATIVLTPVEDPTNYGLVETDEHGNIRRFLEKPKRDEITTNQHQRRDLRARTRDLRPDSERRAVVHRAQLFPVARSSGARRSSATSTRATGSTSGRPRSTRQVHRDIMDGRFRAAPFTGLAAPRTAVAPDVRVEEGATIEGPCFIDEGVLIKAGARVGPYSVIGRQTQIEEEATIDHAIIWPNCRVGGSAVIHNAIVGRQCHVGRSATVNGGAVLGDKTTLTDFSRA